MTAPDAAGIEAALAAGLAAHAYQGRVLGSDYFTCACGKVMGDRFLTPPGELPGRHVAHVAAALLPVVTQAQAAERERIAQAIEATDPNSSYVHRAAYKRAASIARADESGAR